MPERGRSSQHTNSLLVIWIGMATLTLVACSKHEINTFDKYCEDLQGVNLQQKYQPFWSAIFTFSYDADAIRDDYVKFLDSAYLKNLAGRTKRMIWREHTTLHLTNPSSFWILDPDKFIGEWRSGIEGAQHGALKNDADMRLFGAATRLFDEIDVHTWTSKVGLVLDTDTTTRITTDRKEHFDWVPN